MEQQFQSHQQQQQGHFSAHLTNRLNDQGAVLIQTGEYDQAIEVLVKALKIWEKVAPVETCQCTNCSLDDCIMSSRQEVSPSCACISGSKCTPYGFDSLVDPSDAEERFIYRTPIFSCRQCTEHSPGGTLTLIIILNLAMAHHLSAMQSSNCRRRLQKALQLYELAHQLIQEDDFASPRATLIIANNVGEIHRVVQNHKKHAMCMHILLSTMMFMIDCQIPAASVEMEGYFRNTSQLILHNNCAGAA
eukprot:Nitzschia sp. Nitz4//scaffold83_size84149//4940//5680//NITZ4_005161-RA/size84149-processed-gene-0.49-mRNA-1//-1//CDS//3329558908//7499//frame0